MQYFIINRRERKRNRLQNYNYSQNGFYFVTICIKDRKEFFGQIQNNEIVLNKWGKIVKNQWLWLHRQYNYIQLDEYIVMPNHVHGVLVIAPIVEMAGMAGMAGIVGTGRDLSVHDASPQNPSPHNVASTQKIKSLSELMGAFKTTSSKIIHQNELSEFQWQRSFYDHIIRNEKSLNNIRRYIKNNPLKWAIDRNNQENLYY